MKIYEVEKRTLFSSKREFNRTEQYVSRNGKPIKNYVYKTFLFNKPEYLRVRITLGKSRAEIARKSGTYHDKARIETNQHISLNKLPDFLNKIRTFGFNRCVEIKSESHNYRFNGLTVSFNTMEHLGMIVEIEALTNNKRDVPIFDKKISETMQELKLKELNANTYKGMINRLYLKFLRPVKKEQFSLR